MPPLAQPTKGKEKELERERYGKEEQEGHKVVRGQWAPLHMEGKGPREGQHTVVGHCERGQGKIQVGVAVTPRQEHEQCGQSHPPL